MIDRTMLKEHLALERRSITEIATGLSAAAVVGATLYNLGFFAPIEWSLISLLTVQDLLTGAVVALFPMSAAAWAAWLSAWPWEQPASASSPTAEAATCPAPSCITRPPGRGR